MQPDAGQSEPGGESADERIDRLCDEFERAWKWGDRPSIDVFLARLEATARGQLLFELLNVERYWRQREGDSPSLEEYLQRFPDYRAVVRDAFAEDCDTPERWRADAETAVIGPAARSSEMPRWFGEYELLRPLGRGGMGMVYCAKQLRVDRLVALKVIRQDLLSDWSPIHRQEALDRFRHEARAAARLRHERIVAVYDVGEVDGQPFYSMEYVEGSGLDELLRKGPLALGLAVQYLEPVARAVHFAHVYGVLHRDLKPANLLIEKRTGRPKVTDFGLAKLIESEVQLTHTGQVVGTPAYMAPEQAHGADRATSLSDVYSLGATLYHMLCGRPPFVADSPLEVLHRVVAVEPTPLRTLRSDVPAELEAICLKCLEKDPLRRYASADALADDLAAWQEGRPISARPSGAWQRLAKWVRRRPAAAGLIAMAFLLPLVLLASFAFFNLRLTSALRRAEDSEQQLLQRQRQLSERQQQLSRALYDSGIALANQHVLGRRLEAASRALETCPRQLRDWRWRLLSALAHGHSQLLEPETGVTNDLEFSPDGRYLATAGNDGIARVWQLGSSRLVYQFPGDGREVVSLAFSADSQRLAMCAGSTVRLWNLADGTLDDTLDHGQALVTSVAFSPDGGLLATASLTPGTRQSDIHLWSARDADQHVSWQGHPAGTAAILCFSPDGEKLATADAQNGSAKIWSVAERRALAETNEYGGRVSHLAISPDGRVLGLAGNSGVALCDLEDDNQLTWLESEGGRSPAENLSFSRDGRLIAIATLAGDVILFAANGGAHMRTLGGAGGRVAFAPGSNQLATVSPEGQVKIWDTAARHAEVLGQAPATITAVRHLVGLGQFALTTVAGQLMWVNMSDGSIVRQVQAHKGSVRGLEVGRRGKYAVTRSEASVRVWNAATGELAHDVPTRSPISAIAIDPDERILALGDHLGNVTIWDLHREAPLEHWRAHDSVVAVALCPDGRHVLTSGANRVVHFWSLRGEQRWSIPESESAAMPAARPLIHKLRFSPDGQTIAGAGRDRVIRLWRTKDGRLLQTIRSAHPLHALAFTPDGKSLTAVGLIEYDVESQQVVLEKGVVRVWSVEDGRELLTLTSGEGFGGLHFDQQMEVLVAPLAAETHLWHLRQTPSAR